VKPSSIGILLLIIRLGPLWQKEEKMRKNHYQDRKAKRTNTSPPAILIGGMLKVKLLNSLETSLKVILVMTLWKIKELMEL
jgi:hypothetical protein